MADMDWPRFAAAVKQARAATGMSFSAAIAAHPALTKSALTRAETGQVIGAGNVLVICRAFGIDPMHHVVRADECQPISVYRYRKPARNSERIQSVSPAASRETDKPVLTIAAIARRIGRMREGG